MYKKIVVKGIEQEMVFRLPDYGVIPFDPDNYDYQRYLKWLEEGNTPLPADEQTEGTA